jgi:hypothetical protein
LQEHPKNESIQPRAGVLRTILAETIIFPRK